MSTEAAIVVITPKSLAEARDLSATLSKSSLLPDALRGKEAEILMTIMTGAELGLAPMQSIRAIDVIKGKPTLKAETMTALVRGRKDVCEYLTLKVSTPTICTYETKRVGDPIPTAMSFTLEEARSAGLTAPTRNGEPSMWMKYPAAMLRARAGSAICKAVYSDLLLGVYDPDELGGQSERDVTPRASPPSNVIDSVATVVPTPSDYDASGAPVSERAKLEVALNEAQDVAGLTALVERLGRLKTTDLEAYTRLRARWGARRDEFLAAAKIDKSVQHPAEVTHFPPPEAQNDAHPEPGSEG